jgi:hypothetical protein
VAGTTPENKTHYYEKLDPDDVQGVASDIFSARFQYGQSLESTLAEIFREHYSYDIQEGTGPYPAVVLDVVSGPQVKDSASAKGRINTKSLNIKNWPNPLYRDREASNMPPPVIVVAKIPRFDIDIGWPKDAGDQKRIDIHGEYYQFREDTTLGQIEVGSVIWVSYDKNYNGISFDGRPVGKIVGVHKVKSFSDIKTKISPKLASRPECQLARNLRSPAGGFYVGHTDADPNPDLGIPIRKIKGNIRTGMYGNGTPQTKVHFEQALAQSEISTKHKTPGPAPGPNNAFIWIGTLRNNGYMDLLDRPISQGRETIIYAPMSLDLNSPIEIKYYFHDVGGFGNAHINGPTTTIPQAEANVTNETNDFREKIAPAIKDLNRDGRNYILVIPEMAHSRGYGTPSNDSARIESLSLGEDVGAGAGTRFNTLRARIKDNVKANVKEYLNKLPIESNKVLLQVTPLIEREFSTFDGSFTGGEFEKFQREVFGVLDEHLGAVSDQIEFYSIVGDGLGGITIAGILHDIPNNGTHNIGKESFIGAFAGDSRLRIDYITDKNLDAPGFYDAFFGGPVSPSSKIYENFISLRAAASPYTEFNYISSPTPKKQNHFFDSVGKIADYRKFSNKTSGEGQRKFSFTATNDATSTSGVSFHVSSEKNKVGYAFSMVNDFLPAFRNYPAKADANINLLDTPNSVPDHAYALATKPSPGDFEKLLKKEQELQPPISFFEDMIDKYVSPSLHGGIDIENADWICTKPKYAVFCKDGVVDRDQNSAFMNGYKQYLKQKQELAEIQLLKQGEVAIQALSGFRNELIKEKDSYEQLLESAKNDIYVKNSEGISTIDRWRSLGKKFDLFYHMDAFGGLTWKNKIFALAGQIAARDAYEKIVTKIKSAINNTEPERVQRPKDCVEPPKKIAEVTGDAPQQATSREPDNNCSDIKLATPSTFAELSTLIPYFPKKADFKVSGAKSKNKTKIHSVPGYKTSTFKYQARGNTGNLTFKESPRVWACLSELIQKGMKEASAQSKYYPFEITTGIRGLVDPKAAGTTAYSSGISLHSFGLAIDIDPFITGYKNNDKLLNSVFTGAWTPGLIDVHGLELWRLGVFSMSPSILKKNAFEGVNRPRMAENWKEAPSRYYGGGESSTGRPKYNKIMNASKGSLIVPPGANPTLWVLVFCEVTGMRWGNGLFLKRRYNGGKKWSDAEKKRIDEIYKINNLVDRIKAISWRSGIEDHMHFHYWGGGSIVKWKEIEATSEG